MNIVIVFQVRDLIYLLHA